MTAAPSPSPIAREYWQLQAVVWALYAAVRFGATLPIIDADERGVVAMLTLLRTVIGAVFSLPLMLLCRRLLDRRRRGHRASGVALRVRHGALADLRRRP